MLYQVHVCSHERPCVPRHYVLPLLLMAGCALGGWAGVGLVHQHVTLPRPHGHGQAHPIGGVFWIYGVVDHIQGPGPYTDIKAAGRHKATLNENGSCE